jgi:hypothetical protein
VNNSSESLSLSLKQELITTLKSSFSLRPYRINEKVEPGNLRRNDVLLPQINNKRALIV